MKKKTTGTYTHHTNHTMLEILESTDEKSYDI